MNFQVLTERVRTELTYAIEGADPYPEKRPIRPTGIYVEFVNGELTGVVKVFGPFIKKDGGDGEQREIIVWELETAPQWIRDIIADAERRHRALLPEPPAA